MEAKFVSQDGKDFVIEIDGDQYSGVIPLGMEKKVDEAITAFSEGKLAELSEGVIAVADSSFQENEVIAEVIKE